MATIIQEEIRAKIIIADTIDVETPFVKSFNVSKSRGQIIGSFSATVEIPATQLTSTSEALDLGGQGIEIYAGTRDVYESQKIFTGEIKSVQINPSWDKPEYFVLNLSGSDVMSRLEGKTYSRRIPWDSPGMWAKITNVNEVKNKKKARQFDKKYKLKTARVIALPNPGDAEHSSYVYARDTSRIDPYGFIDPASATKDSPFTGKKRRQFILDQNDRTQEAPTEVDELENQ